MGIYLYTGPSELEEGDEWDVPHDVHPLIRRFITHQASVKDEGKRERHEYRSLDLYIIFIYFFLENLFLLLHKYRFIIL